MLTKNQASLAELVKKPVQERFNPLKTCIKDDADMRKAVVVIIVTTLLSLTVAGTRVIPLGSANPYLYLGDVPPDQYTKPPSVTISSPDNNTVYTSNNISFSFNVSKPVSPKASQTILTYIYYKADWQQNTSFLYDYGVQSGYYITEFNYSNEFNGVPDGKHSIVIYANGKGWYPPSGMSYYGFVINGSSTIYFTVDATPPRVSIITLQNETYRTNSVPLNWTVNEPATQVTYSIDGQENITLAGNTTLFGLPVGEHNVTVYAWDTVGNVGASETVVFTVEEPFPTVPVAAVSAASIAAVAAAGLIFARRRRRKEATKK